VKLLLCNLGQVVLALLIPTIPIVLHVICFQIVAIRILTQKTNYLAVAHKESCCRTGNFQLAVKYDQPTRAVGLDVNPERGGIIQPVGKQRCLDRKSWLRPNLKAGEPLD
jgi:hypothetical protein